VHPRSVVRPRLAVLVLLALPLFATGLVACSSDAQPDSVRWRNTTVDLPDGWYLFEDEETRLSISNQDIGPDALAGEVDADGDTVAMWFTYEPSTQPADWRALIEREGWTLESDAQLELQGEVPATRLVYRYESAGVVSREMVVLIPSRAFVILAQPVPGPGDEDVSDVFLAYVDDFMAVLDALQFGSPLFD
jgi:hypothetical protein